MKVFFSSVPAVTFIAQALAVKVIPPASLNVGEGASIRGVAKALAEGALSYYAGSATVRFGTGTRRITTHVFADLPSPYYWWECGALMGALLDYSHYTKDSSYDDLITMALFSNLGPAYDLMVPRHRGDEGNDDQAFWAFAVLAAVERNFPQVAGADVPSWLQVAQNAWNSMARRWNTTACGGGLLWQIFPENPNGLNYRNSVSNGGLFQISARLYRATGNKTYLDWATKVWDWTVAIKMIDEHYVVYDGADSRKNCTEMNPVSFSYAAGIYMYGAAVMANATVGGAAAAAAAATPWAARAKGLLKAADSFFSPFDNATGVMYEHACEQVGTCNTDMKSFKGYLARFAYASALMMPGLQATVQRLLGSSAAAAARACSGGHDAMTCGQKWYVGGFDGSVGLGQEMCALEVVQGLLARQARAPLGRSSVKDVRQPAAPVSLSSAVHTTPTNNMRWTSAGAAAVITDSIALCRLLLAAPLVVALVLAAV